MPTEPDSTAALREKFWQRRAARTALQHNLGSLLRAFLPLGVAASIAFACAVLILRRHGGVPAPAWIVYAGGLLLCLLAAGWRARRGFFTVADARVRLDWHLGLHNRLTAAAAGVGEFPEVQPVTSPYTFRWDRIALPLAGAAAFVLAAILVPLGNAASTYKPTAQPVAWTQTTGWVDALQKQETVQDASLEDLRERLDQLRQQPAQDWYSHSSLEAGDNLRDQTAQSLAGLQRDLETALGAVGAMEKFTENTSTSEQKLAQESLGNALKGLELGTLPLNRDLLNQLKDADLSKLKSLTPAQLADLKRRLQAGTQVCKACLHPGEGKEGDEVALIAAASVTRRHGPGGPGGGESSAPLELQENPTDLKTTTTAPVSNPDLANALPGDLTGIQKGDHTVDPSKYAGPAVGGAIGSTGQGGEAVWRNDLTPSEREVLKRFFK